MRMAFVYKVIVLCVVSIISTSAISVREDGTLLKDYIKTRACPSSFAIKEREERNEKIKEQNFEFGLNVQSAPKHWKVGDYFDVVLAITQQNIDCYQEIAGKMRDISQYQKELMKFILLEKINKINKGEDLRSKKFYISRDEIYILAWLCLENMEESVKFDWLKEMQGKLSIQQLYGEIKKKMEVNKSMYLKYDIQGYIFKNAQSIVKKSEFTLDFLAKFLPEKFSRLREFSEYSNSLDKTVSYAQASDMSLELKKVELCPGDILLRLASGTSPRGKFYTEPGVNPDTTGCDVNGRTFRIFVVTSKVVVLKSHAVSAVDTWTKKGQYSFCSGGGIQCMISPETRDNFESYFRELTKEDDLFYNPVYWKRIWNKEEEKEAYRNMIGETWQSVVSTVK